MSDSNNSKKVVTSLNTGIATPIPIQKNEAMDLARSQSIVGENKEVMQERTNLAELKQQVDEEAVNKVNDIVKVEVVKYSKKTVVIMVLILILIVIIFLVFELPMLLEL